MYRGHDLSDLQRFNLENEQRYYYERDKQAHLDSQAYDAEEKTSMSLPLTSKVVTKGSSSTKDSALEWLKLYGCEVEYCSGITLIRLPENAKLEKGNYAWEYSIGFKSQLDDDETYVGIELHCDANHTVVTLDMDDKYKGVRDYVASFFSFKYKEGVIIKYIKLDFVESSYQTLEHADTGYWETTFNIVSATEDRTISNVSMAFDFVDTKFFVVRPIIEDHSF